MLGKNPLLPYSSLCLPRRPAPAAAEVGRLLGRTPLCPAGWGSRGEKAGLACSGQAWAGGIGQVWAS